MSVPDILPPSPPTTLSRKAKFVGRSFSIPKTSPEDSPASLADYSGETRKRVEFSPWTNVHDPPAFTPSSPARAATIKSLPPSRECQTSSKSILKPFSDENIKELGMDGQNETELSSDETMESIIQQLSTGDNATKFDAYNTLVCLLKVYDEIPEIALLKNKIATLGKFIRRDLASERIGTDPSEINLTTQALKALISLVWAQQFAPLLSDELRVFALDRSIQVLSEQKAPKAVIIHYLHLLGLQSFRNNLMQSNGRSIKLLDALSSLPDRYKGNGVVSERLMVYNRLLDQARPSMQSKSVLWLQALLTGLISPQKDTRSKAILFGTKACTAFPSSTPISNSLRDIFLVEREEDGRTICSFVCHSLTNMIKEDGPQVPQIWTVVIILMSGLRERIGKWQFFSDWLKIIERCFNSSESETRKQANLAWNRLVSIIRPHDAPDNLVKMLVKPITSQMVRRNAEWQGKLARTDAKSVYCNLLYYAFRPAATARQYNRVWNEYVVKVMTSSFFEKNMAKSDFACRVLVGLFGNPSASAKVFKESRAHDSSPVTPEELPTVDCKWIRTNAGTILQTIDVIGRHCSWVPQGDSDQAFIVEVWRYFAKSLGEACSREIKPSQDTKRAISAIARHLCSLEQQDQLPENVKTREDLAERLNMLARITMSQIGVMPIIDVLEADRSLCSRSLCCGLVDFVLSVWDESDPHVTYQECSRISRAVPNPDLAISKLLGLLEEDLVEAYKLSQSDHVMFFPSPHETARLCLRSTDGALLRKCLSRLQIALSLWLEDSDAVDPYEPSQPLAPTIMKALSQLSFDDLAAYEQIVSAALRSTHKETINYMIEVWNANIAREGHSTYPPLVQAALDLLAPFTDLNVSTSRISVDSNIPPLFAPSQSQFLNLQETVCSTVEVEVNHDVQESQQLTSIIHENLISSDNDHAALALSSTYSTPKRRIRHDDPQIHFNPIESSPIATGDLSSQSLTEKQREVRDMQRGNAEMEAFFTDLGSKVSTTNDRTYASNIIAIRAAAEDLPSTPILPTQGRMEDIAASPTPRAKQQALRLEDIDVGSSPPRTGGDGAEYDARKFYSTNPGRQGKNDDVMIDVNVEVTRILGTNFDQIKSEDFNQPILDPPSVAEPLEKQLVEEDLMPETAETSDMSMIEKRPEAKGAPAFTFEDEMDPENVTYASLADISMVNQPASSSNVLTSNAVHKAAVEEVANERELLTEVELVKTAMDGRVCQSVVEMSIANESLVGSTPENAPLPSNDEIALRKDEDLFEMQSPAPHSTDSDELDLMSASQLSNDLNSHLEEEVVVAITPLPPRKRKNSEKAESKRKKRRQVSTTTVSSDLPAVSIDAQVYHANGQPMPDTIVVDVSEHLVSAHDNSKPEPEIPLPSTQVPEHGQQRQELDQNELEPSEYDITSSLRNVLEHLKNGSCGEFDLRAVDDLCFHIRTEAQNADQREGRKMMSSPRINSGVAQNGKVSN